MTYAIHNLHSPAVELIDGQATHDGVAMLKLPEPLFVANTRDEAEEWRAARRLTRNQREG